MTKKDYEDQMAEWEESLNSTVYKPWMPRFENESPDDYEEQKKLLLAGVPEEIVFKSRRS